MILDHRERKMMAQGKYKLLIVCAFLCLGFGFLNIGGCSTGTVNASATNDVLMACLDRHDRAVTLASNPLELSDLQKTTALRSSELLRRTWAEAMEGKQPDTPVIYSVAPNTAPSMSPSLLLARRTEPPAKGYLWPSAVE